MQDKDLSILVSEKESHEGKKAYYCATQEERARRQFLILQGPFRAENVHTKKRLTINKGAKSSCPRYNNRRSI